MAPTALLSRRENRAEMDHFLLPAEKKVSKLETNDQKNTGGEEIDRIRGYYSSFWSSLIFFWRGQDDWSDGRRGDQGAITSYRLIRLANIISSGWRGRNDRPSWSLIWDDQATIYRLIRVININISLPEEGEAGRMRKWSEGRRRRI